MKTFLTCLLAICGLTTACGQAKEQRSGEAQVTYEEDVFQTKSGKTVKFHALVHASIRVEYDGTEIEIDPVTKLGNKTIDYTAMPKANFMANGDKIKIADDFTVEAVPAYNITEGRTQFHPQGRDNGYILTIDGLRIYIAGDTEDIPEMASIKDIDIAFLPCNQPYTMTTSQLVKAAKIIKPKVVFPYHYGQTDVSTLPSQLQAEGIDVRIRHYE